MGALIVPTSDFLARELNDALTKKSKNVGHAVKICCGLSNEEIDQLNHSNANKGITKLSVKISSNSISFIDLFTIVQCSI